MPEKPKKEVTPVTHISEMDRVTFELAGEKLKFASLRYELAGREVQAAQAAARDLLAKTKAAYLLGEADGWVVETGEIKRAAKAE